MGLSRTHALRGAVAYDRLRTLLAALEVLRPAFTKPGFDNLIVVFAGWVLTNGPHAVTQALVVTNVAGRRHHEAFHRFFSRGTWDPDGGWSARLRLDPEGRTRGRGDPHRGR